MNLIIHESDNLPAKAAAPAKLPRLSVNARNGMVTINPAAMQAFGWQEGTALAFAQDEARPQDWYVLPHRGHRKIFALATNLKPDSKSFKIKSRKLALDIVDSIDRGENSYYIPFGEPQQADEGGNVTIPLLTRLATPTRKPATSQARQ
jgi:hypothetical protein